MELINNWFSVISDVMYQLIYWFIHGFVGIPDWISSGAFPSWLQTLSSLATPITLIYIAKTVTVKLEKDKEERQKELAKEEEKRQIESKRQAILSDYFKQMTALLIDKELAKKGHEDPTARVARALTLTTIRELDSGRNQLLTRFLFEAKLIQASEGENNLPSLLREADLSKANLEGSYLREADLTLANLEGTNLKGSYLFRANLEFADLRSANFEGADLATARLYYTTLRSANLHNANLFNANLEGAEAEGGDLRATLYGVNFCFANLRSANLEGAEIRKARFCNTRGIDEDMKADLIRRGAIFDSPL